MIKRSTILSFLLVFLAWNLWPSVQGKIQGTATDSEGNPLSDVAITITSLKMASKTLSLKTDKEGKYVQIGLWPDRYQVRFKKTGFLPAAREVKVGIAETIKLDIVMEKAQEALERSLSKADSLFMKGNKLYGNGEYEEAAQTFSEAIGLNSTQWGYHFNLGLAYKKMDKREEALEAFRKALELNPESFSCNKEVGEVLGKSEKFDEALKYFQKATEIDPTEPDAFYNLGVCQVNLGQSEEALKAFLKTIEIKEDYADAYYPAGTIYIGQNKTYEAVKYLEKFLELAPDHEKASIAKQLLDYLKK